MVRHGEAGDTGGEVEDGRHHERELAEEKDRRRQHPARDFSWQQVAHVVCHKPEVGHVDEEERDAGDPSELDFAHAMDDEEHSQRSQQ